MAPPEIMAPEVGLEPTAYRLTAGCSTIELLRNNAALATLLLYDRAIGFVKDKSALFCKDFSGHSMIS